MKILLKTAIEERRLIHLIYDNVARTLEPHALGRHENGKEVVLCRQVSPWLHGEHAWKVLQFDGIRGLLMLEHRFPETPRTAEPPLSLLSGFRFGSPAAPQELACGNGY